MQAWKHPVSKPSLLCSVDAPFVCDLNNLLIPMGSILLLSGQQRTQAWSTRGNEVSVTMSVGGVKKPHP